MATAIVVTQAELLDALIVATDAPSEARTVAELIQASGLGSNRVRDALKAYKAAGRLGIHRVAREGLDGRQCVVPAYTILPAKKKSR